MGLRVSLDGNIEFRLTLFFFSISETVSLASMKEIEQLLPEYEFVCHGCRETYSVDSFHKKTCACLSQTQEQRLIANFNTWTKQDPKTVAVKEKMLRVQFSLHTKIIGRYLDSDLSSLGPDSPQQQQQKSNFHLTCCFCGTVKTKRPFVNRHQYLTALAEHQKRGICQKLRFFQILHKVRESFPSTIPSILDSSWHSVVCPLLTETKIQRVDFDDDTQLFWLSHISKKDWLLCLDASLEELISPHHKENNVIELVESRVRSLVIQLRDDPRNRNLVFENKDEQKTKEKKVYVVTRAWFYHKEKGSQEKKRDQKRKHPWIVEMHLDSRKSDIFLNRMCFLINTFVKKLWTSVFAAFEKDPQLCKIHASHLPHLIAQTNDIYGIFGDGESFSYDLSNQNFIRLFRKSLVVMCKSKFPKS